MIELTNKEKRIVSLTYGDSAPLDFDLKSLAKSTCDVTAIYKEAFEFIQALSQEKQIKIFEVFAWLEDQVIFNSKEEKEEATEKLDEIYSCFTYQEVYDYMVNKNFFIHPSDLQKDYGLENPNNGITYIYDEYVELAAWSLYLRLAGIFWCSIFDCLPSTADKHKREKEVFDITSKSICINQKPLTRLRLYCASLCAEHTSSLAAIMEGLGTSDLEDWILSIAIIRRIPFFEFSKREFHNEKDTANNLVSFNFMYLMNKLKSATGSFGQNVRYKRMKKVNGTGGDRKIQPFGENYKISDQIPEGDIGFYDAAALSLKQYLFIEPEVDLNKIQERFKVNRDLLLNDEIDIHYTFCQIVCDPIFPPSIITSMGLIDVKDSKGEIVRRSSDPVVMLLSATQVILEHWGFHNLSLLTTAKHQLKPSNTNYDNVKEPLDPELKELSRKMSSPIKEGDDCSIIITVEHIASIFSNEILEITKYEDNQDLTDFKKTSLGYLIHKSIRNDICKLLLKMANHK